MRVQNTTIFMGDSTKAERHGSAPQAEKEKSGTVFAGNLNKTIDPIAKKREEARNQAMKIVGDAWAGEKKIDDDLEERRRKIEEHKVTLSDSLNAVNKIDEERLALRDEKGFTGEDKEEQELRLLEKEADSEKEGSYVWLTKEDRKELARLKEEGLTDYQQKSLSLYKSKEPYEKEIAEASAGIEEENAIIRGTKLERLKHHTMVDAGKEADAVMEAASDEIVGMLMEESKEHVDEKLEEAKEAAEKKAEEEKEEEKKAEKKEEKEQQAEALGENIADSTKQLVELDSLDTDIQKEVQDILNKMKLLGEDIKGAAVDTIS